MFEWYLTQIRNHGPVRATRLFFRVIWRRVFVTLCNSTLPARLTCPCCGWQGRRFFDYIEMGYSVPNAACPRCDSHSRHRALYLWLQNDYRVGEKAGLALVFSPERALAPVWQTATNLNVCKVDLEAGRGADVLADLMRLPFVSDVADLIWCHHVIEQVEDVHVALSELRRALASHTGELIISSGLGQQEDTIEFGFSDKTLSGNRRLFGADFSRTLAAAGFDVRPMSYDLSRDDCLKYGILPEPFYHCIKL